MTFDAMSAITVSVLMHVTWNLFARHEPQKSCLLWWALLVHILIFGPWGLWSLIAQATWNIDFAIIIGFSSVTNALYFFALQQAYSKAPVALVYPLVRSSPLLIALWTTLFFGEVFSLATWVGIILSVIGLFIMGSSAWRNHERSAIPWTIVAMLATSIYSISDKAATKHIHSFGGIVGFITIGYFVSWCLISIKLRRETGLWKPPITPRPIPLVISGLSIGIAYSLVIHAMRFLSAAEVVAYTNTGIVIASLLSMTLYGEHLEWRTRVMGILVICCGLAIIATHH